MVIMDIQRSISADGTRVAVGGYGHNKNGATDAGHVRIYQYTPLVQFLDIEMEISMVKVQVISRRVDFQSLNHDGSIVAFGGKNNDGNGSNQQSSYKGI